MDDEFRKRLVDYFEGFELVELLNISIERIVDMLEEDILSQEAELRGYVNYGR